MQPRCNIIITLEVAEQLRVEPFFVEAGTVSAYRVPENRLSTMESEHAARITFWDFDSDPIECDVSGWSLEEMQIYMFQTGMFHRRNVRERNFCFWKALPLYHAIIENIIAQLEDRMAAPRMLFIFNIFALMGMRVGLYKPSDLLRVDGNMELIKKTISKLKSMRKSIDGTDNFCTIVKAMAKNLEHELNRIKHFQSQRECHGTLVSILDCPREGETQVLAGSRDAFFADIYTECRFFRTDQSIIAQEFRFSPNKAVYRRIYTQLPTENKFEIDLNYPTETCIITPLGLTTADIDIYSKLEKLSGKRLDDVDVYRLIKTTNIFKHRFWRRRVLRTNFGNTFKFGTEEIKYVYNTMIKTVEICAKVIAMNDLDSISNSLDGLDRILNSLRLEEVIRSITFRKSVYFSKITVNLFKLVTTKFPKSEKPPFTLAYINGKITYWLGREYFEYGTLKETARNKPFDTATNAHFKTPCLLGTPAPIITLTVPRDPED